VLTGVNAFAPKRENWFLKKIGHRSTMGGVESKRHAICQRIRANKIARHKRKRRLKWGAFLQRAPQVSGSRRMHKPNSFVGEAEGKKELFLQVGKQGKG